MLDIELGALAGAPRIFGVALDIFCGALGMLDAVENMFNAMSGAFSAIECAFDVVEDDAFEEQKTPVCRAAQGALRVVKLVRQS